MLKILEKMENFSGHFKVLTYKIKENSKIYYRNIVETKNAVFVLPYDKKEKKILLVNEKRFGLVKHRENIETWSSVSGTIDKKKTPEEISIIELKEEANIDAKVEKLNKICTHFSSPGIISEQKIVYIYEFDSKKYKEGVFGSENENEKTITKMFSYDEALNMIKNNEIEDLNCIFSIMYIINLDK